MRRIIGILVPGLELKRVGTSSNGSGEEVEEPLPASSARNRMNYQSHLKPHADGVLLNSDELAILNALRDISRPLQLRLAEGQFRLDPQGPLFVPAVRPEDLGDAGFRSDH